MSTATIKVNEELGVRHQELSRLETELLRDYLQEIKGLVEKLPTDGHYPQELGWFEHPGGCRPGHGDFLLRISGPNKLEINEKYYEDMEESRWTDWKHHYLDIILKDYVASSVDNAATVYNALIKFFEKYQKGAHHET